MRTSRLLMTVLFVLLGWHAGFASNTENFDEYVAAPYSYSDGRLIQEGSVLGSFKYYSQNGTGIYFATTAIQGPNTCVGTACIGANIAVPPVNWLSFTRSDRSVFTLSSITLTDLAMGGSQTLTISGFRAGSLVQTQASADAHSYSVPSTILSGFTAVDSVVINDPTLANSLQPYIDNIVWGLPSQTITFANPGSKNFGTTPTLSATSSSGLAVSFTSSTTGVCTITSGGVLTLATAGTCTINADQAGNASFAAAATVSQSFTVAAVAPGAPTIGTATAGNGQASVAFTAPASNGGATITGYTVTSNPGGFTGTGTASPIAVTGLANGTAYTFTVTATNSAGTSVASAASNSVAPIASQTITFAAVTAQNFGTTPTLSATSSSGLAVSFASSTTGVCTITSGGTLTFVTVGTCTINADQAGNASFAAASTVTRSFTVAAVVPGAPTTGAATAGNGQASVAFTAPSSNGGATITGYTVTSNPGGFTGTGAASPITVTGLTNGTAYTFTVTATNSAGTSAASAASNSVTPITSQTITFAAVTAQDFGTTPTLSATSSSGLAVSFTSSTTGVCTITSGGALAFVTVGTCTINADQAGNASFAAAPTVTRSFTVAAAVPGAPTIGTATAGNGQASVAFTAPVSNGGAVITSYTVTSSPGAITGTGTTSPIAVTGLTNGTAYTFTVTATNSAGTGVASAASNSVTSKAPQTITFAGPVDQIYGSALTLFAASTSSLGVSFSSATAGVCTISPSGVLTTLTTGTCTINADQVGNAEYHAAATVPRSFLIQPRPVLVKAQPQTKEYGSADPTLSYSDTGFVNGDALTGELSRVSGESVGKYAITLGTISVGGNYALTFEGDSLSVTKKPLTITGATASDKVYDGTTAATVTGSTLTGLVNSDAVTLVLGTATFASKDTGTAKVVTVAGSTLSGAKSGNYSLTEVSGLSADITAKSISVTAAAKSKVYGSSDPALTYTASTLYSGDSYAGNLVRAAGDTVGSYAINQGGLTAGGNYSITFTGANLTVTKKPLTIATAVASDKVYDGTTAATVTGSTLTGLVNSDAVTLVLGSATFASKDTGTAKVVTVTGSTLSGAQSGNYSLTEVPSLFADITAKSISVTAAAKSKVYGSSDPALTYTASALYSGDSYTGNLARAAGDTVGSYAINQGGLTAGSNYSIAFTGANLTVTKKPLTIANAAASDKAYDGTTAATVTGSTLTGLVNSDAVTLVLGSATFASKDTGTAKVVTVAGSTLSGAKSGNYSLTEVSGLSADITAKSISVTAAAKSKVYGSSDPALTYTASTLYSGDSYTGNLARAAGDTVGSYAINQGGLTAGGNYSITFTGANLTVTKKPLTITGTTASDKVYDGTIAATVTGSTLTGLVNSDAVTLVLGSATFASKDTGTAKVVTVTGSTLSGAKSGNYSLTEVSGLSAKITAKPISVTATAKSKVYGSPDPALTYTASTLYSGDSYTGNLARAAGDTVGSYAINQGGLTAGGNYSIDFTSTNLSVTPAALTITANDASKFYGQADPVFTASMTGFVNGETDAVVKGLSLSRASGSGVGDYPIIPGGATAANYDITYVNGTLTIKASTGISASRRVNVSTALEFHVSRAFARPALGRGRGDLGIAKHDCDDGSCQSVELALPQAAEVVVGIFDNMGTPVIRWSQTMTDADHVMLPRMDDGRRMARLVWNLRSESGSPVPEGVYVWQIKARLKDGTELKEIHKMGVHTPR